MTTQIRWLALLGVLAAGGAAAQVADGGTQAQPIEAACRQQPTQARYSDCMASALAEAGPSPQQRERDLRARAASRAWYLRVATQLAARGAARDLALAATLRELAEQGGAAAVTEGSPAPAVRVPVAQAAEWRRKAAARAGNDVLANALLMQGDPAADAQLRRNAAARWAKAEPDNLAPLLHSAAPLDTLLADARLRTRFDLHNYELVRWMTAALTRTPPTMAEAAALEGAAPVSPEVHAALAAMALWSASAIPDLSPLADGCREQMLDAMPTRRDDCRHVANTMANASDTAIGEMLGLGLQRNGARSAGERDATLARQRQFDWQMLQWSRLARQDADGGAATFARLLADPAIRGEQDLVARLLAEAGVPLQPPADWQPPPRE